jgi:hypothetical protein
MVEEEPMPTVKEATLIRRINRALQPSGKEIRRADTIRACIRFGNYFIASQGYAVAKEVDIEKLARNLGVLRPNEVITKRWWESES